MGYITVAMFAAVIAVIYMCIMFEMAFKEMGEEAFMRWINDDADKYVDIGEITKSKLYAMMVVASLIMGLLWPIMIIVIIFSIFNHKE